MSAAAAPRQLYLPLTGAAEHVALVHRHTAAVKIGWNQDTRQMHCQLVSRQEAETVLAELTEHADRNVYHCPNGFDRDGMSATDVGVITGCFVDLDYYKETGLAELTPDALVDRIRAEHPELPDGTLILFSGRGMQILWLFKKPVERADAELWNATERALVTILQAYGADPKVIDLPRLLRAVGSINTKSGARASGVADIGRAVDAKRFMHDTLLLVTPIAAQPAPAPRRSRLTPKAQLALVTGTGEPLAPKPEHISTEAQRRQALDANRLYSDRVDDMHTLARLRGPIGDGRRRLLYVLAAQLAWTTYSEPQLIATLQDFAAAYFEHADRYTSVRFLRALISKVLHHARCQKAGMEMLHKGRRYSFRLSFSNEYIVALLAITAEEQMELRTIIGADERTRRRAARRRAAGMVCYAERTAERRETALRLRAAGFTYAAIGEQMGISRSGAWQLLNKKEGESRQRPVAGSSECSVLTTPFTATPLDQEQGQPLPQQQK